MHPGVELVGIAESPDAAPGLDECVLDGILGARCIPEDQSSDGIEVRDATRRELRERVEIAVPGELHEVSHRAIPIRRAFRLVSQGMWDAGRQRVPE